MRRRTALLALMVIVAGGCLFSRPRQARRLLENGIAAYNEGETSRARACFRAALERTHGYHLPALWSTAHFYLGATSWDLGERESADHHLRQCLAIEPGYRPDWTFIAPGLRRRFEALKDRASARLQLREPGESAGGHGESGDGRGLDRPLPSH